MQIDLSLLEDVNSSVTTDPRDIFMGLNRSKNFEYLRDVQTEVLNKWYKIREQKDTVIKMNTGSGKTITALLILKTCIAEKFIPAVYLVPTSQLAEQVKKEASNLGVKVTTDEEDIDFTQGDSILITTIQKVFNGKSVFGVNSEKQRIGSLLVDDVHSCLSILKSQFSVIISDQSSATYDGLCEVLKHDLYAYNDNLSRRVFEDKDPGKQILVPYYIWQKKISEIKGVIQKELKGNSAMFNLPLIEDYLELCDCIIRPNRIEISSRCFNSGIIKSFANCRRRIFMSATIPDDSAFITAMDISEEALKNTIFPLKANDIGERMILFPQAQNRLISSESIAKEIFELAQRVNVSVLVPSNKKAEFWKKYDAKTVDKNNVDDIVRQLQHGKHLGLTVFINKYDGINLPDDACRIIVIDGMPQIYSDYNSELEWSSIDSARHIAEQVQKIEQGIGRGVRSNTDYCAVVLMGQDVKRTLYTRNGIQYLSQATRAQFELSRKVWKLIENEKRKPSAKDILSLIDNLFLKRDDKWCETHRKYLENVNYEITTIQRDRALAFRSAFNAALHRDYQNAANELQCYAGKSEDGIEKGYLLYRRACYVNFIDKSCAKDIAGKAIKMNPNLPLPNSLATRPKNSKKGLSQANIIKEKINSYKNMDCFLDELYEICEDLSLENVPANKFEAALHEISEFVGFKSTRPDHEEHDGPDNLWIMGAGDYLVIECKNEEKNQLISRKDCEQLLHSIEWFRNKYGLNGFTGIPVLVHCSDTFMKNVSPNKNTRIINREKVDDFIKHVQEFAKEISSLEEPTLSKIKSLLEVNKLQKDGFVERYTKKFKKSTT